MTVAAPTSKLSNIEIFRSGPERDRRVSALTPIYNAERFMHALLEDMEAQTIADRLEIVICDTGSPQNERKIIAEFMRRFDNIVYIRTEHRENSHEALNRCITQAVGDYVTLACADDRHRPDALEVMARTLDQNRDSGLVYADSLITQQPNETWAANSAHSVFRWPEFSLRQALMFGCFGPQPMWRRELHEVCGMCDPGLVIAGDYDLFLRLASHAGARHIPEILGLFLEGGNATQNAETGVREMLRILARHRTELPLERIYPGLAPKAEGAGNPATWGESERKLAEAACWIDYGRLTLSGSCPDIPYAIKCYEQACERIGHHPVILNNLAVAHAFQGERQKAILLLSPLARSGDAAARHNLAQIRSSRGAMCDLRIGSLTHPVVADLPTLALPAQVRQPWTESAPYRAELESTSRL